RRMTRLGWCTRPDPAPWIRATVRGGICSTLVQEEGQMRKGRFTAEQIIEVLREYEAGAKLAELCRRHNVSQTTFYKWRAKFGGMTVSDAKRLKGLEDENRRLKQLLADAMLDNQ